MRKYDMYIIKELFANYYYGREYFFYRLFKEYETANKKMKKILSKQIDYISLPIPAIRIYKQLIEQLHERKDFIMKNEMFLVENSRGSASFKIYPKKCVMQSTGAIDIDMILIEALRKAEFNFLVVDLDNGRIGWIKPMKKDYHKLETLPFR